MSDESPSTELNLSGADDVCETKSQTFRKRRLTYTKHHLEGAASAAAQIAVELGDDSDDAASGGGGDGEAESNEEKSKTFRKRRLTFTKHQVAGAMAAAAAQVVDADDDDVEERPSVDEAATNDEEGKDWKKRRLSEDTAASSATLLKSKVVHAGEIMRRPPSPGGLKRSDSRLYQGPYNLEKHQTDEEKSQQPPWKRRMTRRHSEDDSKLPFLRSIVGQYSCHGIEPVYDSDYEHNETDSDDDWLNDFPQEAKVTTSAKINQDRGGIAFPYGNCDKTALFAVYDGHGQGGELVSQFALHHIQRRLEKHTNFSDDIEKAFKDVFLQVDEGLINEPTIEVSSSRF